MLQIHQFLEIQDALERYREARHLSFENQQRGFIGNLYEEIAEFARASNDFEAVGELCDIVVFIFNAFEFEYIHKKFLNCVARHDRAFDLISLLIDTYTDKNLDIVVLKEDLDSSKAPHMNCIMAICDFIESLGFHFYLCMKETIKKIESRSGKYDTKLKKFVKDTSPKAKAKWYEPDFSKCRLRA